jgi:hypothetical protein
MALTLTLERTALNNVEDAAGRWQYEGGRVFEATRDVGWYAGTTRVIFGAADARNMAAHMLEVFLLPDRSPKSLVLRGAHDIGSDEETGSVSAASSALANHIGRQFRRVGNVVTIA